MEEAGLTPLIHPEPAGAGNFARKINWAFTQTSREWFFQGADDIRFSAGWDVEAFRIAERRRASVIGTNDLHNPLVKRGKHSTHTLIRRSYIEEHGGTFDGTGLVFHEGYDHQWVDNEFIETAKFRKAWAFSAGSVVEHFHPHWGNAHTDPTYRKATRATRKDMLLYRERMLAINHHFGANRRQTRYSRSR